MLSKVVTLTIFPVSLSSSSSRWWTAGGGGASQKKKMMMMMMMVEGPPRQKNDDDNGGDDGGASQTKKMTSFICSTGFGPFNPPLISFADWQPTFKGPNFPLIERRRIILAVMIQSCKKRQIYISVLFFFTVGANTQKADTQIAITLLLVLNFQHYAT